MNIFANRVRLIFPHVFLYLVGFAVLPTLAVAATPVKSTQKQYIVKVNPEVVAKLVSKLTRKGRAPNAARVASALASFLGAEKAQILPFDSLLIKGRRLNLIKLNLFKTLGILTFIEQNKKIVAFQQPNDTFFQLGFMWGLNNTGSLGGLSNVDIDAAEAWDITTGSAEVVIGVIDTGIFLRHPDLASNIWVNPGEISKNRKDDDANGYADDIHGYNFADKNSNPDDNNLHGTHVAGIIGASGNNSRGIPGVAWNVKLLALKVLNSRGEGEASDAVLAIDYAIKLKRRGVNIVALNASWGSNENPESLYEAIRQAGQVGIMFIAASGNSSSDNDASPIYPANYRLPNLISVAAVDMSGKLASFSNFGATTVDLAAPGKLIWSTFRYNIYLPLDGTSMAAPYVSGVAALLFSQRPSLSVEQAKTIMLNSTKPLSDLSGKIIAPGIISAYHALREEPGQPIN